MIPEADLKSSDIFLPLTRKTESVVLFVFPMVLLMGCFAYLAFQLRFIPPDSRQRCSS